MKYLVRAIALTALILPVASQAEADPTDGYATLVRNAAPSVVTIIVEEKRIGAGQRAAERASAESGSDAAAIIRRLLSGTPNVPDDDGPSGSLGSGFVVRGDGLIVTNRHVINSARLVKVRLSDGREVSAKIL